MRVPDIIRFSNALSYNGTIRPLLAKCSPADPAPAVVAHRTMSVGVSGKGVNEDEAVEVASLVAAATEQAKASMMARRSASSRWSEMSRRTGSRRGYVWLFHRPRWNAAGFLPAVQPNSRATSAA